MKLPIFVLPNLENQSDVQMLDADGALLTATQFSDAIGGIKSLRFMVGDASIFSETPQITSQTTVKWGRLFCVAFPSGVDTSKRIASGAVILREIDVDALATDTMLWGLAGKAGIDEGRRKAVAHEIASLRERELLSEKKKP